MANKLVIVESPAKARTLTRILGRNYSIKASLGHVRDLPRGTLGIDIENDFTPKYVIPKQRSKTINELKKAAQKASEVFLATDPDREGEAISWHLIKAAGLDDKKTSIQRVAFHEITSEAVKEAFQHPRTINMDLVYAQQARRSLDRLVGYKLRPLLWKKVQRGLSAGRVQSAALRMIVDREKEIADFQAAEYWVIEVELIHSADRKSSLRATLTSLIDGIKLEIKDELNARQIEQELIKSHYSIRDIFNKQNPKNPSPPFTTSTLQQEAWKKLRYPSKKTMVIAQQLYEGIAIGEEGSVGLITYMRTDSTNVAASALAETREYILGKYGKEYLPARARSFGKRRNGHRKRMRQSALQGYIASLNN
jgi:DNA topoisomerase-1